jgi:general secretion pathway protein K
MKKLKDNQRGIALMAVLWVLVLLIALATEFAFSMKMEVNTTRNYKEDTESYYLSKAGLNLALAELFKEARFHSIHEEHGWITGKIIAASAANESTPSPGQEETETEQTPGQERLEGEEEVQDFDIVNRTDIELENGSITYTIRDENGKISINSASKITLDKLLQYSGVEDKIERSTISDSILDWIDTDKNHRLNGAEDDYYRTQNPPYYAKNGPIETIDELLKVRGITEEILYGLEESNDENDENKKTGIANHLTVYKISTVNPNTASEEVLNILFEPEQASKILEDRNSKGFYSNSLSNYFHITSTGKIAGSRTEHTVKAIVEKSISGDKAQMVIHYWNDNVLNL